MGTSEDYLDDYSVYSQLSDDELLQVAVERSLADEYLPQGTSASPAPNQINPKPRDPDSDRHLRPIPPPEAPPPDTPSSANPPTALSQFLYMAHKRKVSYVDSLITTGDAEALMDLVRRRSSSLTEPNDGGWTPLHEAAYRNQLQCLRILVRAHPDSVNGRSPKNQTALLLAAGQGNVSCVDFLLKHGADPNIANDDGETSLFAACEWPSEAAVDLLLRAGAQVNRCCRQGGNALHEACRHGQVQVCRMLLDAGIKLNIKNIYGIQPFFVAAQHGHSDIIRFLAKRGADVNGQAADGASALFEACKNGHVSAVETLLSMKADANRATKSGLLPLHVAVQNNHGRIVLMLIPVTSRVKIQHSGISPLHIAAERDRNEILEVLIDAGFDVNATLSESHSIMHEDHRSTALYFAVHNGNLEAVEMLLEAGADPNLDVFNPLLIAVRLDWIEMAELLLRYGSNVNAQIATQPCSFPAAIMLATESLPMLKLLLDNGCHARPCFHCPYGQKTHPAVAPANRLMEAVARDDPPLPIHFCEAVSISSLCRLSGPIISLLLDYVGHVRLCSRLLDVLETRSEWLPFKQKAFPPHPLMQLCRLEIRRLLGVHRLKLLHTLPLPVRLVRFLCYDVHCSLTSDP